jgi:hypothetical protein
MCKSAVVMLDTIYSEVVWRVLATHFIRQFSLHFPSRVSLCAITFQLDSTSFVLSNVVEVVWTGCVIPNVLYPWFIDGCRWKHWMSIAAEGCQFICCLPRILTAICFSSGSKHWQVLLLLFLGSDRFMSPDCPPGWPVQVPAPLWSTLWHSDACLWALCYILCRVSRTKAN